MGKRKAVRQPTQGERRAFRAQLGSLRSLLIRPSTQKRYDFGLTLFCRFWRHTGRPWPRNIPSLDAAMSEFVEECWQCGDPRSYAEGALSGMAHYLPPVRRKLSGAWRLISAWQRTELPHRAPPFTALLVMGLARQCAKNSWADTAVLLLLGFETFARTGELLGARKRDFVVDAMRMTGVWSLPRSKGGERAGATESLVIRNSFVLQALQHYLLTLRADERLSKCSADRQRDRLLRKRWGFDCCRCIALGLGLGLWLSPGRCIR